MQGATNFQTLDKIKRVNTTPFDFQLLVHFLAKRVCMNKYAFTGQALSANSYVFRQRNSVYV